MWSTKLIFSARVMLSFINPRFVEEDFGNPFFNRPVLVNYYCNDLEENTYMDACDNQYKKGPITIHDHKVIMHTVGH